MCSFWYSKALEEVGVSCPTTETELDDFIKEVKETITIPTTCQSIKLRS